MFEVEDGVIAIVAPFAVREGVIPIGCLSANEVFGLNFPEGLWPAKP
jgi:hypothetical protein